MASLRMFKYLILLTLLSVALSEVPEAMNKLADANNNFTIDVYEHLISNNDGSVVLSPIAAETVLSLALEGARGPTAQQLRRVLYLPGYKDRREAFRFLLVDRATSKKDQILAANKIYLDEHFSVNKGFVNVAVNDYNASVQNLDFDNSMTAARKINNWVKNQTHDKIQNLISPDTLNPHTKMVLVNTFYLNASWENNFKTFRTNKQLFYRSRDFFYEIDTMHSKDTDRFKYYHSGYLKAKFLELPYKNSNLSMNFILPDEIDGLSRIESNLEAFLEPQDLKMENVAVALPRFRITTTIDLKPILEDLGVKLSFSSTRADFSGISDEENLAISAVVQKTSIGVTEAGTEAASESPVDSMANTISKPQHKFKADHPFFFYVRDNPVNVILFAGRFTNSYEPLYKTKS